jgi:hypothetical protein
LAEIPVVNRCGRNKRSQTSTLQSEWGVATTQGYKAVALIARTEVMLLMERDAK